MDAASDGSVPPLDSPVGNFISDRSDADAKYGAEVATDARASPRDDTSDLDVTIAGCVFPLEDYLQVAEGLCRHPSWMVYPKQLASCLIAACEIVHTGDVEAERKSVELTRLYREMTPSAFEKCVVFDDVVNWDRNIQLDILVACKALAELVSVKLSAALVSSPRRAADEARGRDGDAETDTAREDEETPEESDALALLTALTWTFDRASAFHATNRFEPVPRRHRNHDLMVDVDRGLHAAAFAAVPSDALRRRDGADADGVIDITADDSDATARGGDADGFGYELDSRDGFGDRYAFGTRRESTSREHEWLGYVLDAFGSNGGFVSICDALRGSEEKKGSFALLDAAGKAAAACAGELTHERLGEVADAVEVALARVARVARRDVDARTSAKQPLPASPSGDEDHPRKNEKAPETKNEKTNTVETFSLVSSFLRSARRVLTRAFGGGEAERRISEAHRAVIEGLLGVHTFNAQLAALREINMMLESARGDASGLGAAESAAAAAAATSWIARERVVARALRPTYLHHKQYVDQLCVLLRHLSQERALEDAHVDALWDVAFRPDAFEETRKNVSALLTEVAKDFNAEQLDALFRRVERVFGASRAGSSSSLEDPACVSVSSSHDELLEMVQRLAKGDLTGAMAERTLLLLWRAAADGSARGFAEGPEATRSEKKPRTSDAPRRAHSTRGVPPRATAAFARVLEHYDCAGIETASVETWTRRALEAIADANEPAALAAAASLFRAVVSADARARGDADDEPPAGDAHARERGARKKGLKKRRAEMEREASAVKRAARRRARIRALASSSDVVETLVSALERCSEKPKPKPLAAPRSVESSARGVGKTDDPNGRALAAIVDTTLFVLKDGLVDVGPATGRRLWAALAEAPAAAAASPAAAAAARDRGARWMTELLMSPPRVVTPACCLELLTEVITRQPSRETTKSGWYLFRAFFLQAALDANRLAPESPEEEAPRSPTDVDRRALALASPFCAAASPAREEVIDIDIDQEGEAVVSEGPGVSENDDEGGRASRALTSPDGIRIGIPEEAPTPRRRNPPNDVSPSAPFLADVAADGLRVAASCDVAGESVLESFAGLEHLWRIALDAPGDDEDAEATSDSAVATFAADALIHIHVALAADPLDAAPAATAAREVRAREAFLKRTLEHLGEAARAIASASASAETDTTAKALSPSEVAFAERRASRCLLLLGRFVEACERADPARHLSPASRADLREAVPHGGSFRGHPVDLDVAFVATGADSSEGVTTVPVRAHLNATVRWVKRRVARAARAVAASETHARSADCDNVRLVVEGRDLGQSDDDPLAACLRRDRAAAGAVRVHALVHRTDARAAAARAGTASGDEDPLDAEGLRRSRELLRSPRALLARRAETYDALFELSDGACAVVRARAQELLRALPTRGEVRDELRALLRLPSESLSASEARSRRERLRAVLSSSPSRGAYALQALDGILTPPDVSADALTRAAASGGEAGEPGRADEEDALEAETAEEARSFRAAFARLRFARDVLALLPSGVDAAEASLDDAEVDIPSARVAWRDPELRRATCASALSILSVSLAEPPWAEPPLFFPAADADTVSEKALCAEEAPEDSEDVASFASFAADAAPSLATLARAFSDETGADEILATTAVRLFFECARASALFEREDITATALLRVSCFPATLRDVLTRASASAVRRAFAMATLRAALWYPPPETNPPDANEPREKRKNPKKNGPAGSFRPPPGFVDVVLAALADAEARPARCREYFQVLSALLRRRDEDDERCLETDEEEERVANAKLDVAASALFAREVEALRVAPREMDKEEEPDPRLLSRLETLLALLERLDRRHAAPAARAEVDGAVTRLARTLMYRCLFPEAAPLLRPAEATLLDAGVELCGGATEAKEETREKETSAEDDLEDASFAARFGLRIADVRVTEAHLAPACATPATRRAAFALLARLAARRAAAEDFATAGDFGAHFGADVAGEAAALAAPCGEEILDTVAALHHSGAIDSDFAASSRLCGVAARPAHGYVGLRNAGATCYMNAVFQQMFATPALRDAILAAPVSPAAREDSVLEQLRATFAALALSRLADFAPRGFWRAFKDYDGEPVNVREHQDGLEFFGRLQDQVDAEYAKAVAVAGDSRDANEKRKTRGAVEASMGGVFVNQVISKSCPHRSERVEDFTHVSVEVRGKKGLEESLASYVSGELLEADNQWSCESCGAKRDAVKRSCFRGDALPDTLCVHLKRFEFDYEAMQRHKIKSRFEFPETLDMAPFTVEALEKLDGLDPEVPDDSRNPRLVTNPDADADETDETATNAKKLEYRLVGVVVHSGTAFAGHYYSYIRERSFPPGIAVDLGDEPNAGSRWHAFDDRRVEPYDVANLEADAFGGTYQVDASTLRAVDGEEEDEPLPRAGRKRFDRPNSAYMLFYERVERANERRSAEGAAAREGPGVGDSETLSHPARARLPPSIPAMPAPVRRAVMAKNLRFAFESNASADREYLGFADALVRALVEPLGKSEKSDVFARTPLALSGALSGDRRRRRASTGAGESRAKKAARVREADSPGGDEALETRFARNRSDETDDGDPTDTHGENPRRRGASPRDALAARATLGVRFALEFLCRAHLNNARAEHPLRASDAESLRRQRDVVVALVRASPPARLWALRWLRAHPRLIEAFLGAPGVSAEAREAFASVLAAAVASGDDEDDVKETFDPSGADEDVFVVTKNDENGDAFDISESVSHEGMSHVNEDMNHAVDLVVRDVARAAGAAVDPYDGDSELAPVSSWYFRALAAYARADERADEGLVATTRVNKKLWVKIERLSRLETLEPLIVCLRALGTRAGRRRELGQTPSKPRSFEHAELLGNAEARNVGARTRQETVSAVWSLASAMLRACDTTQARRVFARRCASRAAQDLGLGHGMRSVVGFGFHVADLDGDANAPPVRGAEEEEDEETLARVAAEAPSPYGLAPGGQSDEQIRTDTVTKTRVPLTLGAFTRMFDVAFWRALAKTAADPGWHAAGVAARRALCHLCWRWETVSHAAALSVLERLDKAEHVEDVAAALRVCEALLRVEDALAPTRCGFVLEGRAFRHPHALAAEPRDDADADAGAGADAEAGSEPPPGAVPPHLRVALSAAGDRRPEDFPSGVIEQAAFEVCAAPKRLLIARFLVRLAEEDAGAGGAGARAAAALEAQREDFGYVVGALGDEAVDLDPATVPREAEEEPPGVILDFGEEGTDGAPYDETLDDPVTVLARAEAALARAQAGDAF